MLRRGGRDGIELRAEHRWSKARRRFIGQPLQGSQPPGIDAERPDMLHQRRLLAATPGGRRHAGDGDEQREGIDAELGRQALHGVMHAERRIARAQHESAVAQQDVERVREVGLSAQT